MQKFYDKFFDLLSRIWQEETEVIRSSHSKKNLGKKNE
jgi:hypothetical protein